MLMCMTTIIEHGSCYLLVARCQSDSDEAVDTTGDASDVGFVGDDVQDFGYGTFSSAPGIDTISVFPKNVAKCKDRSVKSAHNVVLIVVFCI